MSENSCFIHYVQFLFFVSPDFSENVDGITFSAVLSDAGQSRRRSHFNRSPPPRRGGKAGFSPASASFRLPPARGGPDARVPCAPAHGACAACRRSARSRKWEVSAPVCVAAAAGTPAGSFSTSRGEVFEFGGARVSERRSPQASSYVTPGMEDEQSLQPGGKAVAPARQESPRSEPGGEPQLRHPEVSGPSAPAARTPARPFLPGCCAGSAACAPVGRSLDASAPPPGAFPQGGGPGAPAGPRCLVGESGQAGGKHVTWGVRSWVGILTCTCCAHCCCSLSPQPVSGIGRRCVFIFIYFIYFVFYIFC